MREMARVIKWQIWPIVCIPEDVYKTDHYLYLYLFSYVQWAESGGARVVPVVIGKERRYYEEVNGK